MAAGVPGQQPGTECRVWGRVWAILRKGASRVCPSPRGYLAVTHTAAGRSGCSPPAAAPRSRAGRRHQAPCTPCTWGKTPQERAPHHRNPRMGWPHISPSPCPQGTVTPPWLPATGSHWGVPPASPPGMEFPDPQQAQGCAGVGTQLSARTYSLGQGMVASGDTRILRAERWRLPPSSSRSTVRVKRLPALGRGQCGSGAAAEPAPAPHGPTSGVWAKSSPHPCTAERPSARGC